METKFLKNYNSQKLKYQGNIQIVNKENKVLDVFENNMDLIDRNHPDLKPENCVIINNLNFKIIFSCQYIKNILYKNFKS